MQAGSGAAPDGPGRLGLDSRFRRDIAGALCEVGSRAARAPRYGRGPDRAGSRGSRVAGFARFQVAGGAGRGPRASDPGPQADLADPASRPTLSLVLLVLVLVLVLVLLVLVSTERSEWPAAGCHGFEFGTFFVQKAITGASRCSLPMAFAVTADLVGRATKPRIRSCPPARARLSCDELVKGRVPSSLRWARRLQVVDSQY